MKEKRLNEIKGIFLVAIALIVFVSLVSFDYLDLPFYTSSPNIPPRNLIRVFGAYLAWVFIILFGRVSSYIVPAVILYFGIRLFRQRSIDLRLPKILGILLLLLSSSSLVALSGLTKETAIFSRAGLIGFLSCKYLLAYWGRVGGFIILTIFLLTASTLVTDILISSFFIRTADKVNHSHPL